MGRRNHRVMGCLRLERASGDFRVPPAKSWVSYSRLIHSMSSWVLNISMDGDSTVSLDNLLQCSTMPTVKKMFSYVYVEVQCILVCVHCLKRHSFTGHCWEEPGYTFFSPASGHKVRLPWTLSSAFWTVLALSISPHTLNSWWFMWTEINQHV